MQNNTKENIKGVSTSKKSKFEVLYQKLEFIQNLQMENDKLFFA